MSPKFGVCFSGLSYYRTYLPNLARRVRNIIVRLKQGAQFDFASDMKPTVRALCKELTNPPALTYRDRNAAEDGPRLFY